MSYRCLTIHIYVLADTKFFRSETLLPVNKHDEMRLGTILWKIHTHIGRDELHLVISQFYSPKETPNFINLQTIWQNVY